MKFLSLFFLILTISLNAKTTKKPISPDPKEIIKLIEAKVPEIKKCQNKFKNTKKFKALINITVNQDGSVKESRINILDKKKNLKEKTKKLLKCTTSLINKIKFPKGKDRKTYEVNQPFNFIP